MQTTPPSRCTASVTLRWRGTSERHDSFDANGASQPRIEGAIPPVTIRPTPPRARSAKYAASAS